MRIPVAASTTDASETTVARFGRRALQGVIGVAAVTALSIGMAGAAAAETGVTDGGSTTANVEVDTSIDLSGLTGNFTLTGLAGSTQSANGNVTFNVKTNNLAGYKVTVQSAAATLAATAQGNSDSIPISALSVRKTGTTTWNAMSNTTPVQVHTQSTRSAEAGDSLSNDYQIAIPFVNEDTYTATLNYVATTL